MLCSTLANNAASQDGKPTIGSEGSTMISYRMLSAHFRIDHCPDGLAAKLRKPGTALRQDDVRGARRKLLGPDEAV